MKAEDPLLVTRPTLAKVLGISLRQVGSLESTGALVPTIRGKAGRASQYDLTVVVPSYIAQLAKEEEAELQPRDRKDLAMAQLTELKIARERGDLLPRELVVRDGQATVRGWSAKVRGLPRRLVNAGVVPRDREPAARSVVLDLLTEISRWKTIADVPTPKGTNGK
jgi:hypothetical protein